MTQYGSNKPMHNLLQNKKSFHEWTQTQCITINDQTVKSEKQVEIFCLTKSQYNIFRS